jgi:hypothetical protein
MNEGSAGLRSTTFPSIYVSFKNKMEDRAIICVARPFFSHQTTQTLTSSEKDGPMKKFLKIATIALTVFSGAITVNTAAHAGSGFFYSNGFGGGTYIDSNGGSTFYYGNGFGGQTCLGVRC